jgi:hypothetical protein
MPSWLFLILSFAIALTVGIADSSHGRVLAQVVQGFLSILSLAAIVAAFCFYGWKVGLLNLLVVLTAANVGVWLFQCLLKKSQYNYHTT